MARLRQPNVKAMIVPLLRNHSGKDGAATDAEVAGEEAITRAAGILNPVAFWPQE